MFDSAARDIQPYEAATDRAAPPGLAVRFESITHHYGRHRALDEVDLTVGRGETVALLGPNGAGKSTTISLLLGLLKAQSGTVEVLGTSPQAAVAAGRVGAMLQTGTGAGLPPGVRVEQALRLVRRLYRHPAPFELTVERAGIAHLLDRPTHRLSGGQAQSVRFALAIAGDPELVFLDEPTAAMDIVGQRAFWAMMRTFAQEGRTIVFATHHLQEADQTADRVVVINHGQVVADGPGAALKASVAARKVRFRWRQPDRDLIDRLDGATDVDVRGEVVTVDTFDPDTTVRALCAGKVPFEDLEVSGAGIEEAFVALTRTRPTRPARPARPAQPVRPGSPRRSAR